MTPPGGIICCASGKLTNLRQIAIECGRLYRRAEQREAEVINDKLAAAARAFAKSIV